MKRIAVVSVAVSATAGLFVLQSMTPVRETAGQPAPSGSSAAGSAPAVPVVKTADEFPIIPRRLGFPEGEERIFVYPGKPTDPFNSADKFWYYAGRPVVTEASYDKDLRRLVLKIDTNASTEVIEKAKRALVEKYAGAGVKDVKPGEISLSTLPLLRQRVSIAINGDLFNLQDLRLPANARVTPGTISISRDFSADDPLAALLSIQRLSDISAHVIQEFEFEQVSVATVNVGVVQSAVEDFLEAIRPRQLQPSRPVVVSREVAQTLRRSIQQHIALSIGYTDADARKRAEKLTELALKTLTDWAPTSLDNAFARGDRVFAYDAEKLREDLTPTQIRNLTTRLIETSEVRKVVDEAWDYINQNYKNKEDLTKVFNHTRDLLKNRLQTSGSAGFLGISASAAVDANSDLEFDRLTMEDRKSVEITFNNIRDNRLSKKDFYESRSRDFTGSNSYVRIDPRPADIARQRNFREAVARSAEFTDWNRVDKGAVPFVHELQLIPSQLERLRREKEEAEAAAWREKKRADAAEAKAEELKSKFDRLGERLDGVERRLSWQGATKPGEGWKKYPGGANGVFINVDLKGLNLPEGVRYQVTLCGNDSNWATKSSVYTFDVHKMPAGSQNPWKDGFSFYVMSDFGPVDENSDPVKTWFITWRAVEVKEAGDSK
jgi:hypothetical protein